MYLNKIFVTIAVAYFTLGCDADDDVGSSIAKCLNEIADFFKIKITNEITKHNYNINNNLTRIKCFENAIDLLKFSDEYINSKSLAVVYYFEIGNKLDKHVQLYTPDVFNEFVCLEQIIQKFGTTPELDLGETLSNKPKPFIKNALGNALYILSTGDFIEENYAAAYMKYIKLEVSLGNLEEPLEFCQRSLLNTTAESSLGIGSFPSHRIIN